MKIKYVVQCKDQVSGKIGDFTFDPQQADRDRKFVATSPIFTNLMDLFAWAHLNKIKLDHGNPYNFPVVGQRKGNKEQYSYPAIQIRKKGN